MRYVKMALISFVVFFSMFTVIGLLFPSHINSTNAVIVNNKKSAVLKELNSLSSWGKWHPLFLTTNGGQADADSILFSVDKKKFLFYNRMADSNSISFYIKNDRGRITQHQVAALDIQGDSSTVQVVWNETEKLKWYPWERFRGLVLEKAKKEQLEAVLNSFKQYADTIRSY